MKKLINMVTMLAKGDFTYKGRNYFRGGTYVVTEDNLKALEQEFPKEVRLIARSGDVRRDKSLHDFRSDNG